MIVALMISYEIESHRKIAEHFATVEQIEATRHVLAALLFDSEEQLEAWTRSDGYARRFGGCDIETHELEDMRLLGTPISTFMPKCRHCKWYSEISSNSNVGRCNSALAGGGYIEPHSRACKYFTEG